MKVFPEIRLGKWAVILTLIVILLLVIFFLFKALGLVDFDTGHWWDLTLAIAVPVELTAFGLSIKAIRKERTILTYCSIIIGLAAVLFLLTHSLYIND